MPAECDMRVPCAEDCDAKHEFDQDCCELLISPFCLDEVDEDIDVDEFVHSAFPENTPLEKHVLVVARCLGLSRACILYQQLSRVLIAK